MVKNLSFVSLLALAGCGAIFSDDQVTVQVSAPADAKLTLDGMPISRGAVRVKNHMDHVIVATTADGKPLGVCNLSTGVKARYLVPDIILFETIVPLIVDAATNDWSTIETDSCSF